MGCHSCGREVKDGLEYCPNCGAPVQQPFQSFETNRKNRMAVSAGILQFVKELAKYYMDFLETDFHRGSSPNRIIKNRSDDLKVGIGLEKYPRFESRVRTQVGNSFSKAGLDVKKGLYTSEPSGKGLLYIDRKAEEADPGPLLNVLELCAQDIVTAVKDDEEKQDVAFKKCLSSISDELKKKVVTPFLSNISQALTELGLTGQEEVEAVNEELCSSLVETVGPVLGAALDEKRTDTSALAHELTLSLSKKAIKDSITSYFHQFKATDLFDEISELERNRSISDKKELYLYFYDIRYQNTKYPIFYIPIKVLKETGKLDIEFDAQVYINKRALTFVMDEFKKNTGSKGAIEGISDRIIYLADHEHNLPDLINKRIGSIAAFFNLEMVSGGTRWEKLGSPVSVTDNCYFALFDRSDEAILNDYEEILALEEDSSLVQGFSELIDRFVNRNPETFNEAIDDAWDALAVPDKLVGQNPVPLNAEQKKIMSAIAKEGCDYIVVEGPPGTGKSHTITAIAFNAVLNNQSVLVLSDKKEALDVVEEKITETMDKVRFSESDQFQNPILRLGKTGSTYSKILSRGQINEIRNHQRAIKREASTSTGLSVRIDNLSQELKSSIESEIEAFKDVNMGVVESELRLENQIPAKLKEIEELTGGKAKASLPNYSIQTIGAVARGLGRVLNTLSAIQEGFENELYAVELFERFDSNNLASLSSYLAQDKEMKNVVFGYFGKKRRLEELNKKFQEEFSSFRGEHFHESALSLMNLVNMMLYAQEALDQASLEGLECSDPVSLAFDLLSDNGTTAQYLFNVLETTNEFLDSKKAIGKCFAQTPASGYYPVKQQEIEYLVTAHVTYLLDGRVIDFYDNYRNEARTLSDIVRKKQKFPKEQFDKLKSAFPCILSGIRDYAEYIPLVPALFDLLIIDEASQVSIAQAFPAILRAKKVVVFGDTKQFSNVKSYHASKERNNVYINRLQEAFVENVSTQIAQLERFGKFDIKTSVLEFFEYISNFDIRLLKHFRGYKELISYSNGNFYTGTLQVMKIRGKPIDKVLCFSTIEDDGKTEIVPNTSVPEAEFIISELEKIHNEKSGETVGIITPHTNQQKLISDLLERLPQGESYLKDLKLKIMTFDTCQGDERDTIFYSMVANRQDDKLRYVFVNDLKEVDLETEKKIRAQRLNVGFSRSRECMHFVLSKAADEFHGAVGQALRHYVKTKADAAAEKPVSSVDQNSPMEQLVLTWFYQTEFWNENKETAEINPQFEVGKYLRQLDQRYMYPEYRVDFLLVYTDVDGIEHKVVIEYDGFQEHFEKTGRISKNNYELYMSDEDIFRQKVLEGYGYRFLRINKFNLGDNPIETLDKRIRATIESVAIENNHVEGYLTDLEHIVRGLQDGSMQECMKCGALKDKAAYYDPKLATKYGLICSDCKKAKRVVTPSPRRRATTSVSLSICPKCGKPMVRRTGPYGTFLGCQDYPYCRGTRSIR